MINSLGTGSLKSPYSRSGIKNLSVKMPAVPNMRTKGQCRLSEEELVKRIVKLAQRDAAAGTNSQYAENFQGIRQGSAEWRKLRDNFISLSSPDRMGIIQNRLSDLAGKVTSMNFKGDSRFDLFNILFRNNKKFGSDVGGNFIIFRDEQGNEIARYSEPNGWSLHSTPAESARNSAFYDLWKQVLADAQEELELEEKGEFDITV